MILVFDTSVWISALHFALRRGNPVLAIEKAVRNHQVAICDGIELEIRRILTEKFQWTEEAASGAMLRLLPVPLRVTIPGNLHACRDPNDDMVLECAIVAGAAAIVSSDKDLRALDPFQGIRILTPAEFLAFEA